MSLTRTFLLYFLIAFASNGLIGQIAIEGYVFESGNRGFIEQASITLSNQQETEYYGQVVTDATGGYKFRVAKAGTYLLRVDKSPYFDYTEEITITGDTPTVYLKHEIKRSPGYSFEITIAEKDAAAEAPKDALHGALVEVYNNTKTREELVIPSLERPDFKIDLIKGNHYTILIRKAGFLSKRMEAFVDVEGCILCFEGIGTVTPGVSDNLSEQNTIGVLLANVEMDRYYEGKVIGLNDIYYDFGKADITPAAAKELNGVVDFLKDNPRLKIELGSHTDSRGKSSSNLKLSEARARAAVDYLVKKKGISTHRVAAKGYGETNLTNGCKDGVDCDESEHLLNRRTELKIIDVEEASGQRALRQMKADELMEEILAGIDATGQVKVAAGSDAAAVFEEAEKRSDNVTSTRKFEDFEGGNTVVQEQAPVVIEVAENPPPAEEIKQDFEEEEFVESSANVITPEIDKTAVLEAKDADIGNVEKVEPPKVEPQVVAVSKPAPTTVLAKEKVGQEHVVAEVNKPITEPVITQAPADVQAPVVERQAPPSAVKLSDVQNDNYKAPPVNGRYHEDYSGFKVVVIYSRFELPPEHRIYSDFKDVDVYTTADGNKLYMLGSYKNRLQAEKGMRSKYKSEFPQSYVIGFERGNRVY